MAGTSTNYILHFKLEDEKVPTVKRTHASVFSQTVNCIALVKGSPVLNYYVAGLANGLIRMFDCEEGHHIADI